MEKLEQYLDQVCRSLGGPVEMREHVRQELREHLLDAFAQHKAAGCSEDDALRRAIEEFGKPDEVRTDLEAAHGQRTMWLIDKAMQWKETTMKSKWLWTTWAHLGLMIVILLESLFITFNVVMIIPKFKKLLHVGIIDQGVLEDSETRWMVNFLFDQEYFFGHFTTFLLLAGLACAAVFEWRVKSENKPFIRLSALGSVAVALMILVALISGCLVVLFCMGVPPMARMTRPWAVEQMALIDQSVAALEKTVADKDWPGMQKHAEQAQGGVQRMLLGPATTSLAPKNDAAAAGMLRDHVRGAQYQLNYIQKAIREHDVTGVEKSLDDLRKVLEPLREAAKKPAQ
jgi:uncharacterized membrane protein